MVGNLYIQYPNIRSADFSDLLSCTSNGSDTDVSNACNSFQNTSYGPTTSLSCTAAKPNNKVTDSNSNSMNLWHIRLGHASIITLKHIPLFSSMCGPSILSLNTYILSYGCHTHLSFSYDTVRAPFNLSRFPSLKWACM